MLKHLLSGALLLAFVTACTSEPVTDNQAGGGNAPANANAAEGKLTLTYYNIDG